MTTGNQGEDLLTYEEACLKIGAVNIVDGQRIPDLNMFKRILRKYHVPYVKISERNRRIRPQDLQDYINNHMAIHK